MNLIERPASASLVQNLSNEQYVQIVCGGSLINLHSLFAQIDNGNFPDSEELWKKYREKAFTVFESGRLPRADQRVIRSERFQAKIDCIESEIA
jgi:Leu/Phe-tRNA-protein transferase